MKKIMFFCMMLILCLNSVNGQCSYSEISRMKKYVENINLSYDYKIENGGAKFYITLTNIIPDVYFFDDFSNRNYYYYDTQTGEITLEVFGIKKGGYSFYSANQSCYGIKLGTKYYRLPTYNIYYENELCSDIKNFSLCQKWAENNYKYSDFQQLVYKYKNNLSEKTDEETPIIYEKTLLNKIVEFYVNYYYIILSFIIICCVVGIYIDKKRNSFKL